jgi:tetratricopeptide (TPR) repeat protein
VAAALRVLSERGPIETMKTLEAVQSGFGRDLQVQLFLEDLAREVVAMASADFAGEKVEAAMDKLRAVPRTAKPYIEAQSKLAEIYLLAMGSLEDARRCYGEVAAVAPGSFEASVGAARLFEGERQFGKAADSWKAAIALRPDSIPARLQLSVCLARQGRLDEARIQCLEAIKLDPANGDAQRLLRKIDGE